MTSASTPSHTDDDALLAGLPGWIGSIAFGLLVAAGFALEPFPFHVPVTIVQPEPGCDLQVRGCRAAIDGATLSLEFTARPVTAARPFPVSLHIAGIVPHKVELRFAGTDMDMGTHQVALSRTADGRHTAEAMLPACVSGPMRWRATVVVHDHGRRLEIPHEFLTGAPHG